MCDDAGKAAWNRSGDARRYCAVDRYERRGCCEFLTDEFM